MQESDRKTEDAAGRRRRRRKEARPGELVAAGLAEFADKGFAATRLEDVARRAGVSKATIYLYFDSKEALFEAAVRERLLPAIEGASAIAARFEGPTDALLGEVLAVIYDRIVGTDAILLLKVLVADGARFPHLVRLYREMVLSRGVALLSAILARGIERGEIRDVPAAREPRILMGPAILAALWALMFDEDQPLDRETFRAAHLDVILNGLLVR